MREIDSIIKGYAAKGKGKYKCARNGKVRKTPCATCPNAAKCAVKGGGMMDDSMDDMDNDD